MGTVRVVIVAVLLAACGDAAAPTSVAPPATTAVTTPSTTTTEATPPTTSTVASPPTTAAPPTTAESTTTTTAPAPESWHVPGQRYYFPVQPPEAADYGPDHHDYPATDIFAPEGSTLVAVTDGAIDEVSRTDVWDPDVNDPSTRGGLYVSIIGDDGVRYYYSHLLAVAPRLEAGSRVRAGQVIGAVGRTGNAAATPPHVHFGISPPTFPGDWEVRRGVAPPFDLLRAWNAGEDVTPVVAG